MMVRNEENWVWFAVTTTLPFCRRLMVWDTGSADRTLEILSTIHHPRLEVVARGLVAPDSLVATRNEMLRETITEWFAIVDGDEVWPADAWQHVERRMGEGQCDVVVVASCCPFPRLGLFHAVQDDNFRIAGVTGSYSARVFRRSRDLRWRGEWGRDALERAGGTCMTAGEALFMRVVDVPYWHMTLLRRSRCDAETYWRRGKIQVDDPDDAELRVVPRATLPAVFSAPRPDLVADPFIHTCLEYEASRIFAKDAQGSAR